jgi:hypothetical protein
MSSILGKFCVIRTRSDGVHLGTVAEIQGTVARLAGSSDRGTWGQRRLWQWAGANTLNEVSLRGVDQSESRISEPVEEVLLTEVISVTPCTAEAEQNLSVSRWRVPRCEDPNHPRECPN